MGFEQITGPNSIAPTPPAGDASNRVATTAFVSTAVSAAIAGIPYPSLTRITNSLSANVGTSTVGTYFDGPSVAQGSSGTWFVSGQVTVLDSANASTFFAKLWDGTTVIDSGNITTGGAAFAGVIALSGFISSPAGNIKISVREPNITTGVISFNGSGNSKDSTITAIRIA